MKEAITTGQFVSENDVSVLEVAIPDYKYKLDCIFQYFEKLPHSQSGKELWNGFINSSINSSININVSRKETSRSHNIYVDKVAILLYDIYKDNILCYSDSETKINWFHYNVFHWEQVNATDIKLLFLTTIRNIMSYYKKYYSKRETKDDLDNYIKTKLQLIEDIISDTYIMESIDSLYQKCISKFANNDFFIYCDSPTLMSFQNGILDIVTGKFRNATPADYCTLSTRNPYHFTTQYDMKRINDFLEEIFPNMYNRMLFLTQICEACFGEQLYTNPIQRTLEKNNLPCFFSYSKRCGINTIINFIKDCFGDYVYFLPVISYEKNSTTLEVKREMMQRSNKRRILFIKREGDLSEIFQTITYLKSSYNKIFIIVERSELEQEYSSNIMLQEFPHVKFESKFIDEKEADDMDNNTFVPLARDNQIRDKIFVAHPYKLNEIHDLHSAFVRCILEHRDEILE